MTTPMDAAPPARATLHRGRQRLHPLVAAAALSVTAVSLTGIAAMTGVLPGASPHGLATPNMPQAAALVDPLHGQSTAAGNPPIRHVAGQLGAASVTAAPPVSDRGATAPGLRAATPPEPVPRRSSDNHRSYASTGPTAPSPRAVRVRHASDMATVESVRTVAQPAASTGIGTIGGSVIGGALGSRIGNGNGRAAMAALGAIGGGMLGHEVEQRINAARVYDVTLRMDDGTRRTVRYERDPGLRAGERVRAGDAGPRPAQSDTPETPPFVRIGAPT